jgi:hypothetical protein
VLNKQGPVVACLKERMGLAIWCLRKGSSVHLTYGKRDKSIILLKSAIGIQKVLRVEVIWFFKVMRIVESRAQDGKNFSVLGKSYKIKRYFHYLAPTSKKINDR